MRGNDKRKRYLMEFLKIGRIGNSYHVFGAPEDLAGPYDHPADAEAAYQSIENNFLDYEVVDRKVVRKK